MVGRRIFGIFLLLFILFVVIAVPFLRQAGIEIPGMNQPKGVPESTLSTPGPTASADTKKPPEQAAPSSEPEATSEGQLAAPVLVSASNVSDGVLLKWNAVSGAVNYRVFRKTENSKWSKLGATTDTVFTDTNTDSGTTYYYTVRCISDDGSTNLSSYDKNGISVTTEAEPTPVSKIVLKKGEELTWKRGIPYKDPGFAAYGRNSENMNKSVVVKGEVIPWRIGDYVLTYRLADEAGEIDTVTRTVHVVPQELPATEQPAQGTICLTFNYVPCEYTEELLDLLKSSNVQATFFISTDKEEYSDLLPRIVEDGHALGIFLPYMAYYQGQDGVIEHVLSEIVNSQKILHDKTGKYASFIRFESGTNNAGYLAYQLPGGFQELYDLMHTMGLRVFDWNVYPGVSEKTNLIISKFREFAPFDFAVVAQENFQRYNILAVPKMVSWAKKQGCTFSSLTTSMPEVLMN